MPAIPTPRPTVPAFDRQFFDGSEPFTCIGGGAFGGKAHSLLSVKDLLETALEPRHRRRFRVGVPRLTVIATDMFDKFMTANGLWEMVASGASDHRLAMAFQAAELPADLVGDLWALVRQVHTPLAVRSSSLLEDALRQPFAGVYATKMIPNNQHDAETRFRRLVEAIKLVYASTFFENARNYRRIASGGGEDRMAVIIQAIAGRRHRDRFYPELSGVARSYSFYRSGNARPEDGVVNLALGLGKTIVDGGTTWSYSPAYPQATPPYSSIGELMKKTQVDFWAVNMGHVPSYDPVTETEYLVKGGLEDAEEDEVLRFLASTYDTRSDRLSMGVGIRGPARPHVRAAALPRGVPAQRPPALAPRGSAPTRSRPRSRSSSPPRSRTTTDSPAEFAFLQVRPMSVSDAVVDIDLRAIAREELLLASERVMGNGVVQDVSDVVYVRPDHFEARHTPAVAQELARINQRLVDEGRPYLLIGFGRWGSSDPWLGIPVEWSQINGARAIVEATLPAMNVDLSQGSHFFHNISAFDVSYFSVPFHADIPIDWEGLARRPAEHETDLVRHVRLDRPLLIEVDGRQGLGAIRWGKPLSTGVQLS